MLSETEIENKLDSIYRVNGYSIIGGEFTLRRDFRRKPGYICEHERVIELVFDHQVIFSGECNGGYNYPNRPASWMRDDLTMSDQEFICNLIEQKYSTVVIPALEKEKQQKKKDDEIYCENIKKKDKLFRNNLDLLKDKIDNNLLPNNSNKQPIKLKSVLYNILGISCYVMFSLIITIILLIFQ